jgi:hypothetical protein
MLLALAPPRDTAKETPMRRLALSPFLLTLAVVSACTAPTVIVAAEKSWDISPPPPGEGIQVHIGPFDVAQGQEVQKNFFLKLPVDHDIQVNRIQIAYPPGSHHCNVFKTDRSFPDHVEDTFDAVPYDLFDMFVASQSGTLDWSMPTGVALKLAANQQLIVQTHFVNANTQKTPGGQGEVKLNLYFAKPATVTRTLGMLFAINKNLDIAPHKTTEARKTIDLARSGFNADVKVIAMTGHFHSRGKTFEVDRTDGSGNPAEMLYRSNNWDEPPFKRFDDPITLKAGEKLLYTSTFVNDTDMVIKFGPHVENQEHSNFFMYFYPGPVNGKSLYDVDGLP